MANDYGKKTNAELIEILKSRGLPHTGKKAELVARLQEDDNKKAAPVADDVIDWEDEDAPAANATVTKPSTEAGATGETIAVDTAPKVDESKAESKGAPASQEEGSEGTITAAPEATSQPEEKPAPNYSIGLPITEMEEELKKRKARAEKFGITEDSQAAIDEVEKKLQRAKRFGSGTETNDNAGVSRLDQALPDEKTRKRGRGDNEQGSRGGKRRNFNGRNNFRHRGRGNRNQGQSQGQKRGGNAGNNNNSLSEKDRLAMEARKKRFGASA